ncbi:MAG: hypothetical protein Q4P20_10070, partial [Eubacteriales bacterium]|nr:hypothetical protein [Eubacteriales bacterium]
ARLPSALIEYHVFPRLSTYFFKFIGNILTPTHPCAIMMGQHWRLPKRRRFYANYRRKQLARLRGTGK